MSINPKTLSPEFWKSVSYEIKVDELLNLSNNMNWSFEELADNIGVSSEVLEKIVLLEQVDDELVTASLLKLFPLLDLRLKEHRRNIERQKEAARKEANRKYAFQLKQVKKKAREQHINLSEIMGVNERTFENWTQGKSKPSGLDKKALEMLMLNFDEGIEMLIKIDEAQSHGSNKINDNDTVNA